MAFHYSPNIPTADLCFVWDGMNHKCWDGSSSTHYDLVSRNSGTKTGSNSLSRVGGHVAFTGGGTRVCYISFSNANVTVPTGDEGSWLWAHEFDDAGNIDHPNFSKTDSSGWDGGNGFVFGTGYGTDGLRAGVGGTYYNVYVGDDDNADVITNGWQVYGVTYKRNTAGGLRTHLYDPNGFRLADERPTADSAIGSNSNTLNIGAANLRGGNWNGDMDCVYMWDRALSDEEMTQAIYAIKSKFGY